MSSLETAMIKARGAEKRGDFAEAERVYGSILQKFPGNTRARKGMDQMFKNRALAMMRADAPSQAEIDALSAAYEQGRLAQVVAMAEGLLVPYPRSTIVHNLLGAAFLTLGQSDRAEAALREAHARGVRHPAICNNLGMALANLGRHDEAIAFYEEAAALDPSYAIARNNLGNALKECGRDEEALAAYHQALALRHDYTDASNNLAVLLDKLGRVAEAETAYRQVLSLQPDHAPACNNLANLLVGRGDYAGAHAFYAKALAIRPDYPEALLNLGNLLKRQGRTNEASTMFERAKAARPGYAEASAEQGKAEALAGHLDLAIALFDEALASDPAHAGAEAHRLFYQLHMADWSRLGDWPALRDRADTAISPWAALALEDDPQAQLRRSRGWTQLSFGCTKAPLPQPQPAADGRIRVGYFSADFHAHATVYLMAGLLREHDRSKFEIHAYSYGPVVDEAVRAQIKACTDSFTDVQDMADAEVVALARQHQLDVAVDLKGYTQGGRTQLFAERLAPVQVAFLGYPGTSGADFIDYAVADRTVVPASETDSFSEALMLMPGSYQCNDDQRVIADTAGTRADHGLPETGFVFCCFNQSYKIGPREWAVWMRLLNQVEGSVLWLFQSNAWADDALRAEAAKHGVAPERLVFAPKLPQAEHLARHAHADLFLDTFNYTAHTTASDALWAGLPVVTLAGRQFSARVGASLLTAVGLPDLVTETIEDYEALILALATDPAHLAELRQRLAANRTTTPLFDSAGYARNLEAAFAEAYRRHQAGERPHEIVID
ncbi:tetratricopeptide repeat protein [Novosphingobium sp. JCM 18896]|uniref:tetratricopeptide repeat protein n=1 Tax=Novosphingobium sp. JCM 18896 TaxID=2989731 RepID=UPI00222302F5|nr:tetratricopeptide repeat protein [Novosphingobium sp. JCM 18896]MCW1431465.1 tetratricopeptide repeat protein [Novosphingobium sp. JCM 18896]